ncbi:hypothetical protein EVG20_g11491 [Dentipellis fragilis]|uniref:Uncharacterized protein n=1 Tax=Dentipellis fragilis TaxID=205917 RepID=A0A4Y9XKH3_9AGAM|nr:hypothetical protein EVG20_g11491 [Dentipellis fragilis]
MQRTVPTASNYSPSSAACAHCPKTVSGKHLVDALTPSNNCTRLRSEAALLLRRFSSATPNHRMAAHPHALFHASRPT